MRRDFLGQPDEETGERSVRKYHAFQQAQDGDVDMAASLIAGLQTSDPRSPH